MPTRPTTKGTLSVTPVIILTLFALALFVVVWREETWPMTLRIIIMIVGLAVLGLAIAAGIYWIEYNQAVVAERWAMASEQVVLLDRIARMTPEQLFYAQRYAPTSKAVAEAAVWREGNGSN